MAQRWRLLNQDGTFNVARTGQRKRPWEDLYHSALVLPWSVFFLYIFFIYVGVNLVFGTAYFFIGPKGFVGLEADSGAKFFLDCFFFSVQTLATIGYGKISPIGLITNSFVAFEALTGLLGVALMTGILFARFSRPTARVVFSKNALITMHDGRPCFLFRVANKRMSQIVDAKINVSLALNQVTKEGHKFRMPYDLKLVRGQTALFALSWTVIHFIEEESPLWQKSKEDLENLEAEVIVSLTGTDDVFSSSVNARTGYVVDEILWDQHFEDIIDVLPDGMIALNIHRIHETRAKT